jgi:hypothetical protein
MSANPFEQLAAEQMADATKRKLEASRKRAEKRQAHVVQSDADAPMILGPQEQKLADQSKQMRSYRVWKKSEYDAMKHHPLYFRQWNEFTHRVLELTPDNANEFVGYVAKQRWLLEAELGIRRLALAFIANRLIRIRLEQGLSPMNDSMPFSDEPPTLFETIRNLLRTMT